MFTALLDTCVLWPSLQRDFLLSLAVEGLYRPVWSSAILAELQITEARRLLRRGVPAAEAHRRAGWLIERMRAAFGDAEVTGWEPLDGSYGLPDRDDEHVVAAAVVAGAGAVITDNLCDFPPGKVPAAIAVIPPHQFAHDTVAVAPARAVAAVEAIAARSGRAGQPTRTVQDILDQLEGVYRMSGAVDLIRIERGVS